MDDKTLLHEVIQNELEHLKEEEVGSESYKVTVDNVTKLMDRAIELERIEAERKDKMHAREIENGIKMAQMQEDKTDRIVKDILAVAGIVIPTAVTIWGTLASFKFEQEGTVTTIMGRGFINKLLPKK